MGGPNDLKKEANLRLEHISDVFLSVGAPVQNALGPFLRCAQSVQPVISKRLTSNYVLLREATTDSPVDLLRVEGGWYAVLRLPALASSEEWAWGVLDAKNVYVHPGYLFELPLEACLVVSLLTVPAKFHEGIRRILKYVDETVDTKR